MRSLRCLLCRPPPRSDWISLSLLCAHSKDLDSWPSVFINTCFSRSIDTAGWIDSRELTLGSPTRRRGNGLTVDFLSSHLLGTFGISSKAKKSFENYGRTSWFAKNDRFIHALCSGNGYFVLYVETWLELLSMSSMNRRLLCNTIQICDEKKNQN